MPWIDTVPYEQSAGRLRQLYDRVKGPGNNVDNIMMMHSLRPHSMEGHMALYKQVLHHTANTVAKSFLETIGVWVSLLNRCAYCVDHHFAGLGRLLDDEARSAAIRSRCQAAPILSLICPLRNDFYMPLVARISRFLLMRGR
jgi:AhpD family alkylhydroperoxidase